MTQPVTATGLEFEFPQYKERQGKVDALRAEMKRFFDEAGPDRDFAKVTSVSGDTNAKIEWVQAKNKELDAAKALLEESKAVALAAKAAYEPGAGVGEPGSEPDARGKPGHAQVAKSMGQLITASAAYKGYQNGSGRGPTATIELSSVKALFERTDGWEPEIIRSGRIAEFATRPAPHVVDFIPVAPTSQAGYKYMEETVFDNTAAERAEGATFPEAELKLEERMQPVEKVAVWLPTTDEQLEDVDEAQAYIDSRLQLMIRQRVDLQVLRGDGDAPNLLGTGEVSGIHTQARGSDSIPDAFLKAFTTIRSVGFAEPSVAFIHPQHWMTVQLMKTADGQYIWGHPAMSGLSTLWGVPVAPTTVAPAAGADHIGYTGDYTAHSGLFVRRGIQVQITNSHGTDFINGRLAVRADMRLVMVHFRPAAFAEVTGLNG